MSFISNYKYTSFIMQCIPSLLLYNQRRLEVYGVWANKMCSQPAVLYFFSKKKNQDLRQGYDILPTNVRRRKGMGLTGYIYLLIPLLTSSGRPTKPKVGLKKSTFRPNWKNPKFLNYKKSLMRQLQSFNPFTQVNRPSLFYHGPCKV